MHLPIGIPISCIKKKTFICYLYVYSSEIETEVRFLFSKFTQGFKSWNFLFARLAYQKTEQYYPAPHFHVSSHVPLVHLLFTISPKGQLAHRLNTFLPVSGLEKKFHKLEARAHQLNVNQSETRAKVKEMEDGLNELN